MILKDFHLSRIENVDFDSTVGEFKGRVAEQINFFKENIEIAYCGMILKESTTLKENGLQQGFVVNVLQKKEKDILAPPISSAELDLQEIVRVFQILATRNAYRRVLQKLNKPEVLENIISTTPGLCNDDIALVILQHPELIAKLGDVNAVKKVIEEHPTLASAAKNLVAAVQSDMFASPSASTSTTYPHAATFMGASDDEEMESLSNSDSQNRTSETSEDGEHPVNVITSSQVAAALASTTAAVSRNSSSGSGGSGITPEMMSAALQQAIASTSSPSQSTASTPVSAPAPAPAASSDNVITAAKLEELRRFGFSNDARNIEALQIANGDLETAVNLLVAIFCSVLLFGKALSQFDNFPVFFNELQQSELSNNAARDPREDTGPVRFPQSPAASSETSGVRVGASGFGFIPPAAARGRSVVRAAGNNAVNGPNAGQLFQVL
ncbi:hypothetical protein V9T40_011195 [Parthenolecanium corni]|uniref:UBA domain-containing protein n=1 Tax=Parthenolecanium corni TaxID=536013 RepID=A0AAN9XYB9_9HEMI